MLQALGLRVREVWLGAQGSGFGEYEGSGLRVWRIYAKRRAASALVSTDARSERRCVFGRQQVMYSTFLGTFWKVLKLYNAAVKTFC